MTTSYTTTQTSTFTEARARAVMHHVLEDFMLAASANLIARDTIQRWFEELSYAVENNVVRAFQLQLTTPTEKRMALNYEVLDDGTVLGESKGGGFDPYGLPQGTRVGLCVTFNRSAPRYAKVNAYLVEKCGWGSSGILVEGNMSRDRAYSKDGFGFARSKVGDWE